jgi:hypothetical protein
LFSSAQPDDAAINIETKIKNMFLMGRPPLVNYWAVRRLLAPDLRHANQDRSRAALKQSLILTMVARESEPMTLLMRFS